MISVLILTFNEQNDLLACLDSVKKSDDIVVFDSFSTDRTVEIATSLGIRVEKRRFDNYAAQRNAGLALGFKNPWVLMVDADERVSFELWNEIEESLRNVPENVNLFRMRRKDIFFGQWLRRSSGYPTWFPRLLRVGKAWVEREINEEVHCEGEVRGLTNHLIHYPFSKGVAFWLERHNRYSTMEAMQLIKEVRMNMDWCALFSSEPLKRRKGLKQLAYRLPCRPLLTFLYLYLWRFGFLDGFAGWRFCRMRAFYEFMIDLKVAELVSQNDEVKAIFEVQSQIRR